MDLEPGNFYHIYNRGNGSRKIFFNRENYFYFLKKIKEHLTPFGSVISWCLMPNHFHWVVYVKRRYVTVEENRHPNSRGTIADEGGHPTSSSGDHFKLKTQTLNQSIGILLSSYTRALQKQEKFTGSLFQKRTKAKPLVDEIKIEPAYWSTSFGTRINIPEGKSYLETCIEYVHNNPVFSGLVEKAEDWEFSSYRDFIGLRDSTIIDYELLKKEDLLPARISQSNRKVKTTNSVIIGIGSNIEADKNIKIMLEILKSKVEVLKVSSLIRTKPIGIKNQPDFTNGAVKIQTQLTRNELNLLLKDIENKMGRDRSGLKFGPRCIDLDIVVWNNEIIDDDYYTRDFIRKSVKELEN